MKTEPFPARRDGDRTRKDEDEKYDFAKKEEPDSEDDESDDENQAAEDIEVRDVRYQLEMLG